MAAALERDVGFRQRTFARARETMPGLAEALASGDPPPAADPVEVAALAYLGRTPGWAALVGAASAAQEQAAAVADGARFGEELVALQAELAAEREQAQADLRLLREELSAARKEAQVLARALREEKGARRRAERESAAAAAAVKGARVEAAERIRSAEARTQEAREAEAAAHDALEDVRNRVRAGRGLGETRARLLLDTVVDAAAGLRRELALPPAGARPADAVSAVRPGDDVADPVRATTIDDPALLDQLLSLPRAHLVVDGYNVTKTGYPDLTLEDQRSRLVAGLAALAARCGAEVTCCFDGASLSGRVAAPATRGVRVLFSLPDETADELIRRLVRAEPPGRVIVVASSDREVIDGVRAAGARTVSAAALARRLDRG